MLFLTPLYNYLVSHLATRINHFPLIKLAIYALDKTIFYFLIFALLRIIWLIAIRHRRSLKSEFSVWLLVFYLLLVMFGTVFRDAYFPTQMTWYFNRPLSDINFIPFEMTVKLFHGESLVDFVYNSFGNVLCFLPLGILLPITFKYYRKFNRIIITGMLFSLIIESLQFVLMTGVSDIDDIIFNTIGAAIGYGVYKTLQSLIKIDKIRE
ncbi:MAG: VanZ family protein [Lactobacillus sp.]|nr:VanZ family protein [Lactobacillus sp.]